MARTTAVFTTLAMVLAISHGALGQSRTATKPVQCQGAADPSCSAFSFLEILVTGGSCHGTASADCEAVNSSQNDFKHTFEEWFSEPDSMCDSGKAEAAAKSVATAIAEVWANAAAKVECEGMGFACGWSISNGNTFALAFAEAIAQAAAEAGAGGVADGFCFADVRAVSTVLASAAAQAQADVCTTGGSAEDYQDSYVSAVQVAIANAFASATASACAEVAGEVTADSKCSGNAESTQEGDVFKFGDVCGGLEQVKACTGTVNDKCCSPDYNRFICTCRNCKGPWIKKSRNGDAKKTFSNRKGESCFCLDKADDTTVDETEEPASTEATDEAQEIEPAVVATAGPTETPVVAAEEGSSSTSSPTEQKTSGSHVVIDGSASSSIEGPTPTQAPAPQMEEFTPQQESVPESEVIPGTEEAAEAIPQTEFTPAPESEDGPEAKPTPAPKESTQAETSPKENEGQVLGENATVMCPGAVDTSCSAFASLEILATAGKCTGSAGADCEAVQESSNDFKDAFDEWYGDDEEGMCSSGKAEAAATAVSKAVAKVWANAAVKVSCSGVGFACGWSIADGQSWAIGFAEAVAQAAAEAGSGSAEGFCFADIRAISVVIAEAASQAQSDACTTGQTVTEFQNSYAAAIEVGIATAFARATANACAADGEVVASSQCKGEATSDLEGAKFATGDACAGIARINACTGAVKENCCNKTFRRNICSCTRYGCPNSPWIKKSEYNYDTGAMRSFQDRAKNVCFCLE